MLRNKERGSTIDELLLVNLFVVYVQCDQIWRNFATLAKKLKTFGNILKVYLVTLFTFDDLLLFVDAISSTGILGEKIVENDVT